VDVGGHFTLFGQQIWTLSDVPGHSGNTLKVLGSRPRRPTHPSLLEDLEAGNYPT